MLQNPSISPSRTGDTCSDSDPYRFGLKVGFLTLPPSPTAALKRLMLPFYQRLHNAKSLNQRLLAESGLVLCDLSLWGERRVPVEHFLLHRRLPRVVRSALCPLHFPLSRIFLRSLSADEPSRKKVACLTLRKP